MPTNDKATDDNTHSSQPAAQKKLSSGITSKIGGLVNVIRGTGEVIRGHATDTGHGQGDGQAIIAAGKDKVERGLKKIEGKSTATSAADQDRQGGVGGAARSRDPNTQQASTAAPPSDPTAEGVRGDAAHSPQPAAQQKLGSGITSKVGGVVNVIHGTGEVIRGHATDTGHGQGNGQAIIAAGKDEVERGLKKIEGKSTVTPAADQDRQGGVGGAAPSLDSNTPQASPAAPRSDPTAEEVRGDAAVTSAAGHAPDRGRQGGVGGAAPSLNSATSQASTAAPGAAETVRGDAAVTPAADHAPDDRQGGVGGAAPSLNSATSQASTAAPGAAETARDAAVTPAADHAPDDRLGGVGGAAPSLNSATSQASTTAPRAAETVRGDAAVTPAAGHAPDDRQGGVGGAAPSLNSNTSTAPRADLTAERVRGDAAGHPTVTSAAGNAPDRDWQGGVNGAAPGLDPNTQSSTAAPRADPTAEKVRGDAADTWHPADRDTTSAAANGVHGRTFEQHHDEQTAATTLPRDRPTAVDDPSVQRDTGVRQQGNITASSDRDKEARTIADASHPANAVGQEQPFGTAQQV